MTLPAASPNAGALSTEASEPLWGARMGWLVGTDAAGFPLVDFPGNRAGPLVARRTVPLQPEVLQGAASTRPGVVLMFENGDARLPLIVGLVEGSPTPMLDAMLSEPQPQPPSEPPMEAHVDGKRVTIEGADEIVLKCGEASITLRRNGKLILRGTYVETHASGVNRIKGGSVQVN